MKVRTKGWPIAVLVALLSAGCATQPPAPDFQALVAGPDRSDADRATDARRKSVQLLAFYGVRAGMQVLDISAGGGHNTELLARAVGPSGRVYAQNAAAGRLNARMQKPVMKSVVPVTRGFDDPVPPEARNLDLVTFNINYHDMVHMGVDRARMNR
ncbi:MAG: methyltransferase, partial [Betaproteobacteria bacterium]|nr:methyltransferase [Betaproteobacteria bacterium]